MTRPAGIAIEYSHATEKFHSPIIPYSMSYRTLFCWCLFTSALIPALGATWNPDPSLGNVDQHRHLYEIGRAYGDANFDPDANLVGVHSKNPPNKKTHSTRESTYYAYALLLT